ncbi:MAG: ATP synthase F1 subunit delta [Flavobacteriales bacterium]|nr:ATP synthase F1 subunit delta [Flavobacteriales bacterium]NNK80582.1 ATP synthase F1 subunit delta [Flavobacteriales bacterium]
MKETRVASRYAKSLIELAQDEGKLEMVHDDMALIRKTVDENRELGLLLDSPIIKSDKKQTILHEIFSEKIGEMSHKFIDILVSKNREHLIDDVAEEVEQQYLLIKGVVQAKVISAIPLTGNEREEVLRVVRELDGRKSVQLTELIDDSIIGGFVITVGDKQIDQSVSGRLEKYRQQFSKNQYIADF